MTSSGIKTALNFEGAMTGLVFLYFLKHFLCPVLSKGGYVVMDNALVHKADEVQELIQKTGTKLIHLTLIQLNWHGIKLNCTYVKKALNS